MLCFFSHSPVHGSYPAHRHLIGCQRASLVGADDRCTAKGLHWGQTADDGVLLGHAPCSQSQTGSDDSGKTWRKDGVKLSICTMAPELRILHQQIITLRNSSHCQSHCNLEIIDSTTNPGASVDWVTEMSDVDDPNSDADQCNHLEIVILQINIGTWADRPNELG